MGPDGTDYEVSSAATVAAATQLCRSSTARSAIPRTTLAAAYDSHTTAAVILSYKVTNRSGRPYSDTSSMARTPGST